MQQLDLIIAFQIGQAILGLMVALLLLAFLIEFRHQFLRHWAMSCLAMAGYFGCSAVLIGSLRGQVPFEPDLRLVLTIASLCFGYLHAGWLLLGAWEAARERKSSRTIQIATLVAALSLGLGSAWVAAFDSDAVGLRLFMRLSVLYGVTGLAFLVSALLLARAAHAQRLVSTRLGPMAFAAYGLYLGYISGVTAWMILRGQAPSSYSPLSGLVGFLLLILIGFSIIIWLLEIERRRASAARSQAERAEQRLVHFRMHDPATGLPNRRQIQSQLAAEVQASISKRNRVAVLSIGIHRFGLISQALGWHKTDALIRKLTDRLQRLAPRDATLGRIGERDFLLILPNLGDRDKALQRARSLIDQCSLPLSSEGKALFLNVSGGLCFAPDDDIDAVALIELAKQAQMRAAELGELLSLHHEGSGDTQPHDLLNLERELRQGVRNGDFCLYFQPLVSIRHRRITGFETLLRWRHPKRGVLTPGSFLQEAVHLGVLEELEDQIFEESLRQLAVWQSELALPPLSVSVNLSAQRFQRPGLADKLAELGERFNVDLSDLHLEITESTAMQDFESALSTIDGLHELGCKVCLDDFGTGYSSLSHLRRLSVDYVKLDRSFITHLERDQRERDLTRAIVDLIHSLGMTVLSEGVETRQQLGYMIQCRVDVVQGFLLGKPALAADYREALEQPHVSF